MVSKKNSNNFIMPKPAKESLDLARNWLLLGISALAFAGLFSVLLVAARTPLIQNIFPGTDFFHVALVVHVDLSVLVWLISFSCMMWVYVSKNSALSDDSIARSYFGAMRLALSRKTRSNLLFYTACAGTIAIALSPFFGDSVPLMNNYVPILQNDLFFLGLAFFTAGAGLQMFLCLLGFIEDLINSIIKKTTWLNIQKLGIIFSAVCAFIALLCFYISNHIISQSNEKFLQDSQTYYELLFWGGGHILQYTYAALMVVAWLWMADHLKLKYLPSTKLLNYSYIFSFFLVLPVPFIYNFTDIYSFEYMDFFTQHMRWGGGILAIIVGYYILISIFNLFRTKTSYDEFKLPIRNSLIFSFLLFTVGGIFGMAIEESTVLIPAHYHGSIVGVTLSFMGLTYILLPIMGYKKISGRMANLQPILYGGGQLMHITGLAWSGGYGALRKTPGAVQSFEGQMGMGLMGMGGLLSIIGGLLFVIVTYKSIFNRK